MGASRSLRRGCSNCRVDKELARFVCSTFKKIVQHSWYAALFPYLCDFCAKRLDANFVGAAKVDVHILSCSVPQSQAVLVTGSIKHCPPFPLLTIAEVALRNNARANRHCSQFQVFRQPAIPPKTQTMQRRCSPQPVVHSIELPRKYQLQGVNIEPPQRASGYGSVLTCLILQCGLHLSCQFRSLCSLNLLIPKSSILVSAIRDVQYNNLDYDGIGLGAVVLVPRVIALCYYLVYPKACYAHGSFWPRAEELSYTQEN